MRILEDIDVAIASWKDTLGKIDDDIKSLSERLRESGWYETEIGWKHPDLDKETYKLEEAYRYNKELNNG